MSPDYGLTIFPHQNRGDPTATATDIDFVDDLALLSNNVRGCLDLEPSALHNLGIAE